MGRIISFDLVYKKKSRLKGERQGSGIFETSDKELLCQSPTQFVVRTVREIWYRRRKQMQKISTCGSRSGIMPGKKQAPPRVQGIKLRMITPPSRQSMNAFLLKQE
jgi:hypothetical protein